MSARPATASTADLLSCHICSLLVPRREAPADHRALCPRCRTPLLQRKRNSARRTWSLIIAAAILYIPANTLPVMTLVELGRGEPHTILGGVMLMFRDGHWPTALVVLFASVTVPLIKLIGLSYLLLSVRLRFRWRPRDRTVLYRLIENVGRWSMIDMFVLSILVALVRLGPLANIAPGPAAPFFAAVVVITMFAAMTFDPRLIWDSLENDR